MYDVVIIGAGASGLMCSCILKKHSNLKVLLLDKNDKIGKKLAITGNGRCNLGNINNHLNNYYSNSDLNAFKEYLENDNYDFLDVLDTVNDLNSYYDYLNVFGILIKNDNGLLYPYSNEAITVCKSFERMLSYLNIELKLNYMVNTISKTDNIFIINNEIKTKKVVIATGGMSYPKTGSTGDGYNFLKKFNHSITDLFPSLVCLKTNYDRMKDITGVRVSAVAHLSVDGVIMGSEEGIVQFNNDSLSGICIFNLSRNVGRYLKDKKTVKIILNLVKDYSSLELENYIKKFSGYYVEDALSCIIDKKLSVSIAKDLKFYGKKVKELSSFELEALVFAVQNLYFDIVQTGDYTISQVTSGGASLDDFNKYLESNKVSGLYAIGEVLDVDGKCGGYNLSWAFNSALIVFKKKKKK